MIRMSLLLILAGGFLTLSAQAQSNAQPEPPRYPPPKPDQPAYITPYKGTLQMAEVNFDFGNVPSDSKVSHVFWLRNLGQDTLEILSVNPACGCTKAPLKTRYVPAGDSAEVELIYSSGRNIGKFNKTAHVVTSDNNSNGADLLLMGNTYGATGVAMPVTLDPAKVEFPPSAKVTSATVKITNTSNQTIIADLVSSDPTFLDVRMPKGDIKPGASKNIEVKLLNVENAPETGLEKSFTVSLNDPIHTKFTVPVFYAKAAQPGTERHGGLSNPSASQPGTDKTAGESAGAAQSGNTVK